MPSVLLPNYSLGQISNNFFSRSQSTSLSQFIANNFTVAPTVSGQPTPAPTNNVNNTLLQQIMVDTGNGPISQGMQALTLLNSNVLAGTQVTNDIFNNVILYGGTTPLNTVTALQGRNIVLQNLQMATIITVVPTSLQTPYYTIIDAVFAAIKSGTYNSANYSAVLLSQSRLIAQSASSILNGNS
jgi:hypothetical protein